ncbi:UNVERIFIED_CONTAM: hypothetical protein FKN15_059218 [Acipenser sinensis]
MDAGLMLYNNLKDVKWSTTSLPLDRLVSSYRLPQIVKLDTGQVFTEHADRLLWGVKSSVPPTEGISSHSAEITFSFATHNLVGKAVLHAAVSYTLPWLCDCTWSRLDTRPSDLGAYAPGAHAPGAHAFSASAPSVSQCLVASGECNEDTEVYNITLSTGDELTLMGQAEILYAKTSREKSRLNTIFKKIGKLNSISKLGRGKMPCLICMNHRTNESISLPFQCKGRFSTRSPLEIQMQEGEHTIRNIVEKTRLPVNVIVPSTPPRNQYDLHVIREGHRYKFVNIQTKTVVVCIVLRSNKLIPTHFPLHLALPKFTIPEGFLKNESWLETMVHRWLSFCQEQFDIDEYSRAVRDVRVDWNEDCKSPKNSSSCPGHSHMPSSLSSARDELTQSFHRLSVCVYGNNLHGNSEVYLQGCKNLCGDWALLSHDSMHCTDSGDSESDYLFPEVTEEPGQLFPTKSEIPYEELWLDQQDQGVYHDKVRNMIAENRYRLLVNINDLRRKNDKRANLLLNDAFGEQVAFQRALKDFVASIDGTYAKQFEEFHIGFEGSFGGKHVSPRTLTARFLGNLVCVEGIVTKCSLVRPKVTRSVHYCPTTKKTIERKYTDLTSLDAFPSSAVYPTKDEENNPLETEFGLCTYKDHQTLTIQEMPEKAPAGQLPRSVDVIADDDLVDQVKPGDRVQVIGIYRCLPAKHGGFTSGTFSYVKLMSKEITPTFSAGDVSKIKKFCKAHSKDIFRYLSKSLAPSIHGHEYIKKAILCLLLGGNEKVLENGTRIRGDINVLLIGDPSVAKSQLLRYVLHTAPRAIPTTGRGSSGVGLTAAVTTDQETGERRLEAGAMVLADRGVVCIDEFDKMSDMDRTAIHEVMEQGRVTIAKAGIHAQLNARCSVLAAANPVYGRYDQYKTPMENIGLQDSLLSRFDLLFIVLDQMDPDIDRDISDHVLRMHRYRAPGEQDGTAMPMGCSVDVFATDDPNMTEAAEQELHIYEKHDNLLHGQRKKEKIVSMEFIRKYIHVAKLVKPVLTKEAADYIAEEYSKLRSHEQVTSETARVNHIDFKPFNSWLFSIDKVTLIRHE